jgi:hypothetical protein
LVSGIPSGICGRDSLTPETILDPAAGEVTIWFANEARHDYDRMRLQLAHEAIHVLCGGFKRQCLTFEEGLAVQFSLFVSTQTYANASEHELPPLYANALARFRELKATPQQIRELRKKLHIDDLQPSILEERFGAPSELASALCMRVSPHDPDRRNQGGEGAEHRGDPR